ncbi:unnamed protein product [Moneuplotes crassus]|uniref:Uncharacterized protein n=1 Tax=Euplotes crassus TaxID=5936 RepID=A0AAD1Y8H7_EUPCR|nr:unnamed protein product [Moneuplotes crassus]
MANRVQDKEVLQSNTIVVDDYAEARAHEIHHFSDHIGRKARKLTHQMLPRSMKRRAMSHNYYRVPIRIRYKTFKEGETNTKLKQAADLRRPGKNDDLKKKPWHQKPKRAKTRKHKRRTKDMLQQYYKRITGGYQWMETHIWHAKRFHMDNKWGYKVPARCNDKCMRGSYRHTQLSSTLIDLSYYITLKVTAEGPQEMIEFLHSIKFLDSSTNTLDGLNVNYLYETEFHATTEQGESKVVAPCTILFKESTEVILNFHPAAFTEIAESIGKFDSLKCCKIFLNQFKLMGHEAVKVLYSVIRPLLANEEQIKFFDEVLLPNWTSFSNFQNNETLYVPINNPNSDFRMNDRIFKYEESAFKEQNLKQLAEEGLYFNSESAKKSKQKLANEKQKLNLSTYVDSLRIDTEGVNSGDPFSILEENPDLYLTLGQKEVTGVPQTPSCRDNYFSNLHDHCVDLDEVNQKITVETTRTNYTHRKNLKTNFELESKIKSKKREIKLEKVKEQQKEENKEETKDAPMEEQEQSGKPERQVNKKNQKRKEHQRDQIVLNLVFNRSKFNQFGHGFTVFIESGYSLGLLRRFSYARAKVIGLKEYKLIMQEKQELVYPDDYPNTQAYKAIQKEQIKEALLKYCLKPPKKRLNFAKINSPFAFSPDWSFLSCLAQIQVSMPNRTPDEGYYICLPQDGDLSKEFVEEETNLKVYESLKISPKDYNSDYEILYKEPVYPNTCKKNKLEEDIKMEDQDSSSLKVIDPANYSVKTGLTICRELIGFITSGGYSMLQGHGVGKGSIDSKHLAILEKIGYVLIRSPSSTKYFKAKIVRIY